MSNEKRSGQSSDGTAEHPGEARDEGKLPPGSGLDHRQARNTGTTDQSQRDPAGGVDPEKPDSKTR